MHLKDIILQITWVELLSLVIFLFIANRSVTKGLKYEIAKLLQFVISSCVAFLMYGKLAEYSKGYLPQLSSHLKFFSFFSIFCTLYLLFNSLINFIEHILLKDEIGSLEKFAAFLIGAIRSLFLISAVLIALSIYPSFAFKNTIYNLSISGKFLVKTVPNTTIFTLEKTANKDKAQNLVKNFEEDSYPKIMGNKSIFEDDPDSQGTFYKSLIERYKGYLEEVTDTN